MSEKILIMAGSLQEAYDSARRRNVIGWRYIRTIQDLRGYKTPTVQLVGTYDERKDWPEIRSMLYLIEAKIQRV